jgi:hypothetical protein
MFFFSSYAKGLLRSDCLFAKTGLQIFPNGNAAVPDAIVPLASDNQIG